MSEDLRETLKDKVFAVAAVLSPTRLVLNGGSEQGIRRGDRFQIYVYGEMMKDPVTNEDLERVLLRRGTGRVISLQKRISTVESDATVPRVGFEVLYSPRTSELVPFDKPQRGDKAIYLPAPKTTSSS